jgi:hypothetical protein
MCKLMPPMKKKPVNSESTIEIVEDTVLKEKAIPFLLV